jgi:hypothetical protein
VAYFFLFDQMIYNIILYCYPWQYRRSFDSSWWTPPPSQWIGSKFTKSIHNQIMLYLSMFLLFLSLIIDFYWLIYSIHHLQHSCVGRSSTTIEGLSRKDTQQTEHMMQQILFWIHLIIFSLLVIHFLNSVIDYVCLGWLLHAKLTYYVAATEYFVLSTEGRKWSMLFPVLKVI